MATLGGNSIPTMKVEGPPDQTIKPEPNDSPSPYMDEMDEDGYEDAGDLDFNNAQRQLWLNSLPRSLLETLAQEMGDAEEIEVGTVRIEGSESDPTRVNYKLRTMYCICSDADVGHR